MKILSREPVLLISPAFVHFITDAARPARTDAIAVAVVDQIIRMGDLIMATGGPAMTKAAHNSGKPAYCSGRRKPKQSWP